MIEENVMDKRNKVLAVQETQVDEIALFERVSAIIENRKLHSGYFPHFVFTALS